jgi:hypothetical protein
MANEQSGRGWWDSRLARFSRHATTLPTAERLLRQLEAGYGLSEAFRVVLELLIKSVKRKLNSIFRPEA